jgi:DMSO/TMAO reductase YedYZ heme-binding membrane subunit
VKADLREPLIYAAIVATLLGMRLATARLWDKFSPRRSDE